MGTIKFSKERMIPMAESYAGKIRRNTIIKQHIVDVAAGRSPADLVLKNARYLNVFSDEILQGDIAVADGLIVGMGSYQGHVEYDMSGRIVLPGFVDSHIHLESALVSPAELCRALLPHGTTTVVTDPHEIANVMGIDGIDFMLQATENLPMDVWFMLPSCVPATPLDESGAVLDYRAIDPFYEHPRVRGLAEMMNYVGTVAGDSQVLEKITAAQAHHKKIDGHAPGLAGKDLNAYVAAGVYSDHECYDLEDALGKLRLGQYIMIREGTAARNLDALLPLLTPKYADPLHFPGYPEKIESLKEELKMDEAVVTGYGKIFGRQTAIAVMDARFMMASMGSVVGEKITSAIERATKEKLPVIIFSCSGGARMQEGMISLMQMAKTSAALRRHADAGLPYFSVITDPTTGGVTASFASLGDVILAEPGCLIGFAGQRVIEQTIFQKLPKGFQSAEFALEHGIIDAIVERKDMKKALSRLLELHMPYVPEEKKEEGE